MSIPRPVARNSQLAVRVLQFAALALLLFLGFRGFAPAPPVGPFLDPVHGVWAVARGASLTDREVARVPALGADVRVTYDDRGVPHIFATSVEDATRALGFDGACHTSGCRPTHRARR